MARPKSKELTDRELQVMRTFWDTGEGTADEARKRLASDGVELAYVTIANVVRTLAEKGFLKQVTFERPFVYRAKRTFDDVAGRLLGDLVQRLFDGSRERLLLQLFENRRLTKREREMLREVLKQQDATEK